MKAWLEAQGHTSYFLDFDERAGVKAGTNWEQILYQRLRQCQAVIAIVTPNWLNSKWCFAEVVQAREKGKPVFPVKYEPCELDGVLSDLQSIDLTADPEAGYRRLATGLKERGLDPGEIFDWNPERPPYPGLPAFEEADAAVFFGRTAEILEGRETLDGLRRHHQDAQRLVLIIGPSGSGKSSLARAGIISRLKKNPTNWLPLRPFRPQDESSPINALAIAFAEAYSSIGLTSKGESLLLQLTDARLPAQTLGELLVNAARELTASSDRRDATVLITIDQAEELFSAYTSDVADKFLNTLGAALATHDRHLIALATLRSDFLGTLQNHVALCDQTARAGLTHMPLTVGPIPPERFAELIHGPARLAGISLEDRLVSELVNDSSQPDALPLLAFTLRRLYDLDREDSRPEHCGKLEYSEYEQLGGLEGAIRNEAERILDNAAIDQDTISALRESFIPGMVQIRDDSRYARRRAFWDELPEAAHRLLNRFVSARLLVADVANDGRRTLEVAHEALLMAWPRLTSWLTEDRDKLRQHNAIIRAAAEWNDNGRTDDLIVHRDGRLKDTYDLIAEKRFSFPNSSPEIAYLEACAGNQRAREDAIREEQERRLKDAQRIARRTKVVLWVTVVAAVGLGSLAAFAYRQRNRADAERRTALSQNLAANARVLFDRPGTELQAAALLAAESVSRQPSPEGDAVIRLILSQLLEPVSAFRHKSTVGVIGMSPDAHHVVSVSPFSGGEDEEDVIVTETETGKEVARLHVKFAFISSTLSFSPNGEYIIISDYETLWVWRWQEKRSPIKIDAFNQHSPTQVSFSKETTWLAGSVEGGVEVYEVASGSLSRKIELKGATWNASSVHFSPHDNNLLFIGRDTGDVLLVDVTDGRLLASFKATRMMPGMDPNTPLGDLSNTRIGVVNSYAEVGSVLPSPDGTTLLVADDKKYVHVWRVTNNKPSHVTTVQAEDTSKMIYLGGRPAYIAFDPTGQTFASANDDDGVVTVWETKTGKKLASRSLGQLTMSLAFAGDGIHVVSAQKGDTAIVWDWTEDEVVGRTLQDGEVKSVAVAGSYLATGASDSTLRVWRLPTAERLGHRLFDEDIRLTKLSPRGDLMATVTDNDIFTLSDTLTGREVLRKETDVDSVEFSNDSALVAVTTGTTCVVFSSRSGEVKFQVTLPHGYEEYEQSDGSKRILRILATSSDEDIPRLFEGREVEEAVLPANTVSNGRVEKELGNSTARERLTRITSVYQKVPNSLKRRTSLTTVRSLMALSQDGKRIALSALDYVWVFDVESGKLLGRLVGGKHEDEPNGRPDTLGDEIGGLWFADADRKVTVLIGRGNWTWDVDSQEVKPLGEGDCLGIQPQPTGFVIHEKDGQLTVLSGKCGRIQELQTKDRFLNLSSDASLLALEVDKGEPPPTRVVLGYNNDRGDFQVNIWNTAAKKISLSISVESSVESTAFSADSHYFAVGTSSGLVRIFDIPNKVEMARISHKGPITYVAFNSDSSELFSRSKGWAKRILVSPLSSEKLVKAVCARSVRNLTGREWNEYLGGERHQPTCAGL